MENLTDDNATDSVYFEDLPTVSSESTDDWRWPYDSEEYSTDDWTVNATSPSDEFDNSTLPTDEKTVTLLIEDPPDNSEATTPLDWLISPFILGLTGAAIFVFVLLLTVFAVVLRINMRRRLSKERMKGDRHRKPPYTHFDYPTRAFSPRPSFSEDKPRVLQDNISFSSKPPYRFQPGSVPRQPIYDIPEVSECRPSLREFEGRSHQRDLDSRSTRRYSGLHGDIGLPNHLHPRLYSFSTHPEEELMPQSFHSFATLDRARLRSPSRPVSMYGSYLDYNGQIHVYNDGYSIPKARLSYARAPSRPPSYTPADPYQSEAGCGNFPEMQEEYGHCQENPGPEVRKVAHVGVNTGYSVPEGQGEPLDGLAQEAASQPPKGPLQRLIRQETASHDRRWSSLKVTQDEQKLASARQPRPRLNSVV